ncbi:CBF-domain-containing protein [Neolentinus lepideus HHB14362 ss-1]|uniref:CBF-domain-containing protein n=1 Tax=Neolentinus lepideus HHB14362 ss-1 TaxID=1314782 RepID=A0A165VWN5_9AGAM|nr:CBF-domain-containing protein [Neolentinus lepideus HHB14362 ss-1]
MGRRSKSSLKDQVLALGGDERDLELLKDIGKGWDDISGSAGEDPNLTKDVSKFLKELKLGDSGQKREKESRKEDKKKSEGTPKETRRDGKKSEAPAKEKSGKKEKAQAPKSDTKEGKGKQQADDSKRDRRQSKVAKPYQSKEKAAIAPAPKPAKPTKIVFEPDLIPKKAASTSTADPSSPPHILPTPHWYTIAPTLPTLDTALPSPAPDQLASLSTRAASLFASLPPAQSSSASDASFLQKIMQSGTLADKLSALTLLVQGSPIHNVKALETLKGMANKGGGRDERLKACRCLVDWWVGGGAPDRKLKYFRDQPLLHPSVTPTHLLVWHFEDFLKKFFFSFLQLLEALTLDPLPYPRTQALSFVHTLLRDKPEQEQNLLRLIVNKLGDPTKQVPSRASHHLLQLLQTHPAMKGIVVREVAALMFRPPVTNTHVRFSDAKGGAGKGAEWNVHALYYGAVTLNQVVLSHAEADRAVARTLVDVYFKIFEGVVGRAGGGDEDGEKGEKEDAEGEKGKHKYKGGKGNGKGGKGKESDMGGFAEMEDANSKLVSQVLTGVNRALPYAHLGLSDVSFTAHIDTLFRITHTATFSTSLQALTLLLQITTTFSSSSPSSSAASTSTAPSSANTTALAASITDRFYRTLYGTLLDSRLADTAKHAMYLNLLLKALKLDVGKGKEKGENERVKAVVRRLVQILLSGGVSSSSEVVVGGMWLLGELFNTVPGLRAMVSEPPKAKDGEEEYDPKKRDPRYAHAGVTPMWELVPMLSHYHPTVSLHARQLLHSQPITSSADLSLNSLTHFLDRFVYKNPKKAKTQGDEGLGMANGGSVMQPAAADGTGVRKLRGHREEETVRDEGWWKRAVNRVPVDQMFFHKYFNEKDKKEQQRKTKKAKRKGGEGDEGGDDAEEEEEEEEEEGVESSEDEEEEGEGRDQDEDEDEDARSHFDDSDADEAEIWKAMKASMKNMDDMAAMDVMEDSEDEVPSGLDDDEDEVPSGLDDDDQASEEDEDGEQEGEDDAFSMAEASDAEDLIDLDADVPDGLIAYDGSNDESEGEEWEGLSRASNKKRKYQDKDEGRRKKKLKRLPTFASYDDYQKMIEEGPEDNI